MRRYLLAGAAILALLGPAVADTAAQVNITPRVVVLNPDGSIASFGGAGGGFTTTSPSGCVITQSNVTLPAGTSTQLVAAGAPKDLHWQVTGTNPMTVSAGTAAAVVNQGINYQGSTGTGQGGGAENFSGGAVPTNAFQAISAAGTTATVWGCY